MLKYRTGFVSNSSSSSFVLANKTGNTKTTIEVDLEDLFETTITTVKELDAYYLEHNTWRSHNTLEKILEDEYIKDEYQKSKEKLSEGYTLFMGSVGNDDENPLSYYFYQEGFGGIKGFEVLEEGN